MKVRLAVFDMETKNGSFSDSVELKSQDGRLGVFASKRIPAGAVVLSLQGLPLDHPNRHSIQIDDSLHLDEGGLVDGEMNHACMANAFVDSSDPAQPVIRALASISGGAEVTINYCASEDRISEPFECRCGFSHCYGMVRGFSYLTAEQRWALKGQISPYLLRKYRLQEDFTSKFNRWTF